MQRIKSMVYRTAPGTCLLHEAKRFDRSVQLMIRWHTDTFNFFALQVSSPHPLTPIESLSAPITSYQSINSRQTDPHTLHWPRRPLPNFFQPQEPWLTPPSLSLPWLDQMLLLGIVSIAMLICPQSGSSSGRWRLSRSPS